MVEQPASFAATAKEVALSEALARAASRLDAAGIAQPRREARLLAAFALGLTPEALLRLPRDHGVSPGLLDPLVERRAGREPLAYITGRRGFWTLELAVGPSALIPRPETETLIEAALELRPDRTAVRVALDLGCGSGALLLAALSEYRSAFGVGVDRSPSACRLAHANAALTGLAARTAFTCGDWARALDQPHGFDLVLSNPPYVETGSLAGLMPEIARHEPPGALDGGADGLDAYRALLPGLPALLAAGGLAILEVGAGQVDRVASLAGRLGLAERHRRHDLNGTARALCLELSSGRPSTARSSEK